MRMSRLYSFVAVALLVGLGLGLIYLYSVDRISAVGALAIVLALGIAMVVSAVFADAMAQERAGLRGRVRGAR